MFSVAGHTVIKENSLNKSYRKEEIDYNVKANKSQWFNLDVHFFLVHNELN